MKPLHPSARATSWAAHEGVVLSLDWSASNNLIVSGGEDGLFRVWDDGGCKVSQLAQPYEQPVTAVAWAPGGDCFAAGAFNQLWVVDQSGWVRFKATTRCGSLHALAWAADGLELAAAGSSGELLFGGLRLPDTPCGRATAVLTTPRHISVREAAGSHSEELDFRERVSRVVYGFGHLVVTTASSAAIYSAQAWAAPALLELREPACLVALSQRHVLLGDASSGLNLFSLDGRLVCQPKLAGLRPERLGAASVSLAPDAIAVVDRSTRGAVRVLDTQQGKQVGDTLVHTEDLAALALSQTGPASERRLVYLDSSRDLFITSILRHAPVRLAAQVVSFQWAPGADSVAASSDGALTVWHGAGALFVDADLAPLVKTQKQSAAVGKAAKLVAFDGRRAELRRGDGATVFLDVGPETLALHEALAAKSWDRAARLARFARSTCLWACLAAAALANKNLALAEEGYAALDMVDKVGHLKMIRSLSSEEARAGELALLRRRPEEAEAVFLQAGLLLRAVYMNVAAHKWERALELAVTHRAHVDTMALFRSRHLAACGRGESLPPFLAPAVANLAIDEAAVTARAVSELGTLPPLLAAA